MRQRLFTIRWIVLALAAICIEAHAAQKVQRDLFADLQPLTHELSRYRYFIEAMPQLSEADKLVAQQLLASSED